MTIETLLFTEKEILMSIETAQFPFDFETKYSLHIFCDLHVLHDSNNEPTSEHFYSAIVQLKHDGKLYKNFSCVNVRDRRSLKKYKTWQSLVNTFKWDDRCSVTFRSYELDDEDFYS